MKQLIYNVIDKSFSEVEVDIVNEDIKPQPTEKERIEALEQAILVLMGGSDV